VSPRPPDDGAAATLPIARPARERAQGRDNFLKRLWPQLGAAFVAAIAYVDPGNFATNISGGAQFGYLLLWVVLSANLMGMLIQNLSAKVGVATGKNLPELCRELFPRRVSFGLWIQAELIAMATDLAEFVGAAIALNLLFGVPLFPAGLITAVVAFAVLGLRSKGYRRFEIAIAAMLGIILLGFLYDTFQIGGNAGDVVGGFVPAFAGSESVLFAVGILGATVMPHVIYLHSALTADRTKAHSDAEKKRVLRYQRIDVLIAMTLAGIVNMAMLVIAASLFHGTGANVETLQEAHHGFETLVGGGAALAFAVALLASGFASSSVGTLAGQVVMQGFINRMIPLFLRRLVTMVPALLVLAIGLDPTRALVLSQVLLSFGIPFALIPLVLITRRKDVMGALVNRPLTTVVAAAVAAVIVALNIFLLVSTFGVV
jgi:manganese transport protein